MSNYNTQLQSNNTDLQTVLQALQTKAAGGEQATPVISVNSSNGLITATAGTKSSTYQLAFQAAKTITPSTASQVAVSSGYYTGGNITVAAVPTQSKTVTPTSSAQNITPDSGKFLSKVTINGDSDLVAGNIKSGVNIFGVTGTYVGSGGGNTSVEDSLVTRTVSNYTNDRVTSIGNYAFQACPSLTTASFPAVTTIGISAFGGCVKLATISFPAVTTIGNYAFQACTSLTTVSFPKATSIGNYAFAYCSKMTTASFPAVITIGSSAFQGCSKLTTVNFPVATSIEEYAFYACRSLTTTSFPKVTSIGSSVFYNCSSLTTASFPAVTTIGNYAFQACTSLTTASFPAATSIGIYAFSNCNSLTTAGFPKATSIGNGALYSCRNLTTASFPKATSIGSYAFAYCYNLKSLYLTGSSICKLSASNAFSSTPIGGYSSYAGVYGSIYVPASLLTSYKTATNWTYFSSRFVGI